MTGISRISQQKKEIITKSTDLLRAVREAIDEMQAYVGTENKNMKEMAESGELLRSALASGRSSGAIDCIKILTKKLAEYKIVQIDNNKEHKEDVK